MVHFIGGNGRFGFETEPEEQEQEQERQEMEQEPSMRARSFAQDMLNPKGGFKKAGGAENPQILIYEFSPNSWAIVVR